MTGLTKCNDCGKTVPNDIKPSFQNDRFFDVSHWGEDEHITGDICYECMEQNYPELLDCLHDHRESPDE